MGDESELEEQEAAQIREEQEQEFLLQEGGPEKIRASSTSSSSGSPEENGIPAKNCAAWDGRIAGRRARRACALGAIGLDLLRLGTRV